MIWLRKLSYPRPRAGVFLCYGNGMNRRETYLPALGFLAKLALGFCMRADSRCSFSETGYSGLIDQRRAPCAPN